MVVCFLSWFLKDERLKSLEVKKGKEEMDSIFIPPTATARGDLPHTDILLCLPTVLDCWSAYTACLSLSLSNSAPGSGNPPRDAIGFSPLILA